MTWFSGSRAIFLGAAMFSAALLVAGILLKLGINAQLSMFALSAAAGYFMRRKFQQWTFSKLALSAALATLYAGIAIKLSADQALASVSGQEIFFALVFIWASSYAAAAFGMLFFDLLSRKRDGG